MQAVSLAMKKESSSLSLEREKGETPATTRHCGFLSTELLSEVLKRRFAAGDTGISLALPYQTAHVILKTNVRPSCAVLLNAALARAPRKRDEMILPFSESLGEWEVTRAKVVQVFGQLQASE